MPPEDQLGKNLIEGQLKANTEAFKGASVADLVNKNSTVYKAPEIPKEPTEQTPKPKYDEDGFPIIDTLRTYQGDIASAVQHDNLTMSKIAILEQNKRGQTAGGALAPKTFKAHLLLGILISVLFVGGVGAVAYSFIQKKKNNAPVAPVVSARKIISAEENTTLNITHFSSEQIFEVISKEVVKIPKDKTIRNVAFERDEKEIVVGDFLQSIGARTPAVLLRNLYDNFFFGINFVGSGKPFLIMFTSSYDIAYANLLEWEATLLDDFKKIFASEIDPEKSYVFKDKIIGNKDTRALEDAEGNMLFFYTFVDNQTIVFAKNEETLEEVIDRMRIESLKK